MTQPTCVVTAQGPLTATLMVVIAPSPIEADDALPWSELPADQERELQGG